MIKYLGSKRQLIQWITEIIGSDFPRAKSVLDLFSGTSRVGYALKNLGYAVHANDHNLFAYHLARCYVEADSGTLSQEAEDIIAHLNQVPGCEGFFTETYCIKSRFFHPKNGIKIDAIRAEIEKLSPNEMIKSILLVSLMEAADRVDSTCGIQMAFLKDWAKRAHNPLVLRVPKLIKCGSLGPSKAHCLDALEAAQTINCDVAYLDPPYNQHSYRGNYHIWETLVRNDKPDVYGTAQKRVDCQTVKSAYNSKPKFRETLETLLDNLKSKRIVLSFSDEGFIGRDEIEALLSKYGPVATYDINYKRYVGAQIGIYNPKGLKVGQVKKLHNKEFLYVVNKDA